jgi:hypothetical protein
VDEPLEVLLDREGRDCDEREGVRRRCLAPPAEAAEDDSAEREHEEYLRRMLEVRVEPVGRTRGEAIGEGVRDEHPGSQHRQEHEPHSSAVHAAMIRGCAAGPGR